MIYFDNFFLSHLISIGLEKGRKTKSQINPWSSRDWNMSMGKILQIYTRVVSSLLIRVIIVLFLVSAMVRKGWKKKKPNLYLPTDIDVVGRTLQLRCLYFEFVRRLFIFYDLSFLSYLDTVSVGACTRMEVKTINSLI